MTTSLRDTVHGDTNFAAALAAKDCDTLADIMNATHPRVKSSGMVVGNGAILDALGITDGNLLLDVLNSNNAFRYVKPLLEQGRLEIGKPLVQSTLQSLVPAVLSQENANKLMALGQTSWPYTAADMHAALFNEDGTEK